MSSISFHYNTVYRTYSVIFQDRLKIRHLFICIIGNDQRLSAVFQILNDLISFFLRQICRRSKNKQTGRILRNTILSQQIQRLDLNICLLYCLCHSSAHWSFIMSFQSIQDRHIIRNHIINSTCKLTFAIESRCLLCISLVIDTCLVHIAVVYYLAFISAYYNNAVIANGV